MDESVTSVGTTSRSGFWKGCAVGCLVLLLLAGVALFFGARALYREYHSVMERFEREGYARVEGQVIDLQDPVMEPTIFVGQAITLKAGSTRGVAFLCQTADIDGTVEGNVHFYGQVLTVRKGAHLKRDLHLMCQVANVYGQVDGEIDGTYQTLNRTPP